MAVSDSNQTNHLLIEDPNPNTKNGLEVFKTLGMVQDGLFMPISTQTPVIAGQRYGVSIRVTNLDPWQTKNIDGRDYLNPNWFELLQTTEAPFPINGVEVVLCNTLNGSNDVILPNYTYSSGNYIASLQQVMIYYFEVLINPTAVGQLANNTALISDYYVEEGFPSNKIEHPIIGGSGYPMFLTTTIDNETDVAASKSKGTVFEITYSLNFNDSIPIGENWIYLKAEVDSRLDYGGPVRKSSTNIEFQNFDYLTNTLYFRVKRQGAGIENIVFQYRINSNANEGDFILHHSQTLEDIYLTPINRSNDVVIVVAVKPPKPKTPKVEMTKQATAAGNHLQPIAEVEQGDSFRYTFTINNPNPTSFSGVIKDDLPEGIEFIGGTTGGGIEAYSYDAQNNKLEIAVDLPPAPAFVQSTFLCRATYSAPEGVALNELVYNTGGADDRSNLAPLIVIAQRDIGIDPLKATKLIRLGGVAGAISLQEDIAPVVLDGLPVSHLLNYTVEVVITNENPIPLNVPFFDTMYDNWYYVGHSQVAQLSNRLNVIHFTDVQYDPATSTVYHDAIPVNAAKSGMPGITRVFFRVALRTSGLGALKLPTLAKNSAWVNNRPTNETTHIIIPLNQT